MPGGRPSKMNVETLQKGIKNCIREGRSIEDTAALFEVTIHSIYRWFEKDPEFRDAINEAREMQNDEVEVSFFSRTKWNDYTETREILDHKGNPIELKTKKRLPPDINAMRTWLMFRRPEKWGSQAIDKMTEKENDIVEAFDS